MLAVVDTRAQVPVWQSVAALASANGGTSAITATVPDASGGLYVVGSFQGSVTLGTITLTSAGGTDVFVARWSGTGSTFIWAQRAGGPGTDVATSLAVAGTNVYVGGYFEGTASFGSTSLQEAGGSDAFVAKLADVGAGTSFGWARRAGGPGSDQVNGLAAAGTSVYATGTFTNTANFGTISLTSAGISDAFISKLTDAGLSGDFTWTQGVGGPSNEFASAMVVQGSNIFVTGLFSSPANFGNLPVTATNGGAIFIAKLLDAGPSSSFIWVQQSLNGGLGVGNALAVRGSSVYLAGRFQGTLTFGSTVLTNPVFNGSYDVFVAKLTDAGPTSNWTWAQRAGGSLSDYATAVAVSGANVYVAGGFGGAVVFGTTTLTSISNSNDVFVTKLTDAGSTGSFAWALGAGGTGYEEAQALALFSSGRVCVSGGVQPPARFGTIGVNGSAGVGFIASLPDPTLTATAGGRPPAELVLFPNPAHGRATVQIPVVTGTITTATLTILDVLGRPMRTQPATANSRVDLDLTGLAPGLYAVRVQAGPHTATQRLVVE